MHNVILDAKSTLQSSLISNPFVQAYGRIRIDNFKLCTIHSEGDLTDREGDELWWHVFATCPVFVFARAPGWFELSRVKLFKWSDRKQKSLQVSGRLELSRIWVTEGKITSKFMDEIQRKSILVRVSECVDLGSQLYNLLLNNYWSEVKEQVHCWKRWIWLRQANWILFSFSISLLMLFQLDVWRKSRKYTYFALESNRIIYIPRHEKRGPGISISVRLLRRA